MKFKTREGINKELEEKGYAEVLGYYYYDVKNDKYIRTVKNNIISDYNPLSFDKEGYNKYGFNIYNDDPKKQYTKRENNLMNLIEEYTSALIDKAINLANRKLSIEEYIKTTKMPLIGLICFISNTGILGNIINSLYNLNDLYCTIATPFIIDEYLKNTKYKNKEGKFNIPTEELVIAGYNIALNNNLLINNINMRAILCRLNSGEISIGDKFSYNYLNKINCNENANKIGKRKAGIKNVLTQSNRCKRR